MLLLLFFVCLFVSSWKNENIFELILKKYVTLNGLRKRWFLQLIADLLNYSGKTCMLMRKFLMYVLRNNVKMNKHNAN